MRRKTLDNLLSAAGLLMAVVLLVTGGLLTWASTFVGNQVHEQLSAQNITMPSGPAIEGEEYAPLREFAGEQMTTGAHARAYADYFIKVHMDQATDGRTYSELGADISAAEEAGDEELAAELTAQRESRFKGETLRGLLLYGYAFATMGTIAGIAAIGAYIASALMFVLSLLGFRHAKRVSADVVV
ncbi:hypothetical protein [Ornithinicoccus hortensis]|uniref:Aromatic ring-opening dioxygenase LigA n=1 Tax=Ornithinicoccus hortensis TaxID=82346 RepID=A0A542YVL2_9MICO|nr:hypothetical protein [Ornithinicoccus hortensis]TQL52102.1 hypothetical protein FB467_3273 [Ornithinicoccus hortensis]